MAARQRCLRIVCLYASAESSDVPLRPFCDHGVSVAEQRRRLQEPLQAMHVVDRRCSVTPSPIACSLATSSVQSKCRQSCRWLLTWTLASPRKDLRGNLLHAPALRAITPAKMPGPSFMASALSLACDCMGAMTTCTPLAYTWLK